ncbi:hypothetical protein GPJ56_002302 [Histomonas meleagridis]|uniref:uncharacterized protein n=1 Tax=Histomonas meleagridis TaxID=135588 RepID=UPI0035595F5D|nr:hypothetical protein GPJ56_002302 [Histomonas meleagridis]KAH0804563.1 hypothetical protein GO595_003393 [Histomonas meleagridis]
MKKEPKDLETLQQEIDKLKAEMNQLYTTVPSIPRNIPDEEIGDLLLKAFLNEEPFDRHAFALLPVKEAFLNAAYQTNDQEILFEAFRQVRQTLTGSAFNELINSNPKLQGSWKKIAKTKSPFINMSDQDLKDPEILRKHLPNMSGLMKVVTNDTIARIEKKDFKSGYENSDPKWLSLISGAKDPSKMQPVRNLIWSKWNIVGPNLSGIPPIQGALYAKSRGLPPQIVNEFAKNVKKNEVKELIEHGINV